MATAPFAARETRLNTAVFAHLANTSATLGGVAVTGIFDNGYAQDEFGGSGSHPIFTLPTTAAPSNSVGAALVVGSTTYTVAEMMPDGTGVTVLRLRT